MPHMIPKFSQAPQAPQSPPPPPQLKYRTIKMPIPILPQRPMTPTTLAHKPAPLATTAPIKFIYNWEPEKNVMYCDVIESIDPNEVQKKRKRESDKLNDEIKRRRSALFIPKSGVCNDKNQLLYEIAAFLIKERICRCHSLGEDGVHHFSPNEIYAMNNRMNIKASQCIERGYAFLFNDPDEDRSYAGVIVLRGKTRWIKTNFGQRDGKFHMDTKIILHDK